MGRSKLDIPLQLLVSGLGLHGALLSLDGDDQHMGTKIFSHNFVSSCLRIHSLVMLYLGAVA